VERTATDADAAAGAFRGGGYGRSRAGELAGRWYGLPSDIGRVENGATVRTEALSIAEGSR